MSIKNSGKIPAERKEITFEELNPNVQTIQFQTVKHQLSCFGPFTMEKQMGFFFFMLTFICNLLSSSEVIYLFNNQLLDLNVNISFLVTSLLRILFFLFVCLKLVSFKRFLYMITMYDPISIPMVLSIYAYSVFIIYTFELTASDYASMVMMVFLFLFFAAYHRVIMTEIHWRKWQIIMYKISLGLATGVYAIWGVYFIFPGIKWTDGEDPELDEGVKEFIIFYVIASADFLIKMLESACQLDRTAEIYVDERSCSSIIKYKHKPQQ